MIKLLFLLFPFFLFAQSFSVATYNVYNLFDDRIDTTEYPDFSANRWGKKEFEQKLANLVQPLKSIGADVLALQEVENENALIRLQKKLSYKYRAFTKKDDGAVGVALLSNLQIIDTQIVRVGNASRDILKVTLLFNQNPFTVYVNHWNSLSAPEAKRIASAQALMDDIASSKVNEYIILGDLNSNYDRYLYRDSITAINHVLQTIKDDILITTASLRKGAHANLWLELPAKKRFSYFFKGRKNTLDHIVIPFSMVDGKGIDYVADSFNVYAPSYLLQKNKIDKKYSDHLPLVARFSTEAFTPKKQNIAQTSIKKIATTGLSEPAVINDAIVTYTDKYGFILKDKSMRSIFVYAPQINLSVGACYNVAVERTKRYNGAVEIENFLLRGRCEARSEDIYLPSDSVVNDTKQLNGVFQTLRGNYFNNRFYYNDSVINIYFQDKSKKPQSDGEILLQNVRIGIYKGALQIVVSDTSKVKRL